MTCHWKGSRQKSFPLLVHRAQYMFPGTWQWPQCWQFPGMCLEVGLGGRRRKRALVQIEIKS